MLCFSTAPFAARARASSAPARAAVAAPTPSRSLVAAPRLLRVRGTPTEEGMQSEKDPFEVPQTGRNAPMSEDKRAHTPEQGAAPEGDRAIKGQAWQPTEQDGETPEERYGSKEAAEEAAEQHKDKSQKSELQTGDTEGQYSEGSA